MIAITSQPRYATPRFLLGLATPPANATGSFPAKAKRTRPPETVRHRARRPCATTPFLSVSGRHKKPRVPDEVAIRGCDTRLRSPERSQCLAASFFLPTSIPSISQNREGRLGQAGNARLALLLRLAIEAPCLLSVLSARSNLGVQSSLWLRSVNGAKPELEVPMSACVDFFNQMGRVASWLA